MTSIAEASTTLFSLLEPFSSEDRAKILRGTLILLSEEALLSGSSQSNSQMDVNSVAAVSAKDAASYFNSKKPNQKVEEFAVAARFLEITKNLTAPKKLDFETVIATEARRDFDEKNFGRDIGNAKAAGLFNNGSSVTKGYTLSYFGQEYVDALPDREKVKNLNKPKKAKRKKKAAKSKSK